MTSIVVVTGGASGIGAAICTELAIRGYSFELGEGLSAGARRNLDAALAALLSWLAQLPIDQVWPILLREGLEPLTPHTKTDRMAIEADLKQCQVRGFATSDEENELGVRAIAAPITILKLTGERHCVGVVSVAAPTSRMSQPELEAHAPLLKATVARLGEIWPMDAKSQSMPPMYKTAH